MTGIPGSAAGSSSRPSPMSRRWRRSTASSSGKERRRDLLATIAALVESAARAERARDDCSFRFEQGYATPVAGRPPTKILSTRSSGGASSKEAPGASGRPHRRREGQHRRRRRPDDRGLALPSLYPDRRRGRGRAGTRRRRDDRRDAQHGRSRRRRNRGDERLWTVPEPGRSHAVGGRSSAGAGAAVRSGAVDLALGVDQGGSGRIPAAFCGVVGIKATHGLVPSFGVGHIDHTIDHVTPHRAGSPRRRPAPRGDRRGRLARPAVGARADHAGDYASAAGLGVERMRIGVIEESVSSVACDASVLEGLERAVSALREAGAIVEHFSLPIWADGFATFQPFVAHLIANTIRSEGIGYGHLGYIDVDRLHAFAVARRAESRTLNPYIKCWMLADRFLHERNLNVSFGVLQNQRLLIRRRISEALADWDVLLTPTVPMVAPRLLGPEPVDRRVARALSGDRGVQHRAAEPERPSRSVDPDRVGAGRSPPHGCSGHRSTPR